MFLLVIFVSFFRVGGGGRGEGTFTIKSEH